MTIGRGGDVVLRELRSELFHCWGLSRPGRGRWDPFECHLEVRATGGQNVTVEVDATGGDQGDHQGEDGFGGFGSAGRRGLDDSVGVSRGVEASCLSAMSLPPPLPIFPFPDLLLVFSMLRRRRRRQLLALHVPGAAPLPGRPPQLAAEVEPRQGLLQGGGRRSAEDGDLSWVDLAASFGLFHAMKIIAPKNSPSCVGFIVNQTFSCHALWIREADIITVVVDVLSDTEQEGRRTILSLSLSLLPPPFWPPSVVGWSQQLLSFRKTALVTLPLPSSPLVPPTHPI